MVFLNEIVNFLKGVKIWAS